MPDRHYFYCPSRNIYSQKFTLPDSEAHHVRDVLRMNPGNNIWLTNGEGYCYAGHLDRVDQRQVAGSILASYPEHGESELSIHVALGIIKRDRLEWALEKATELGIVSFTPLVMDRSVKRSVNPERLHKITLAAMKQSGRSRLPEIRPTQTFKEWITHPAKSNVIRLICDARGEDNLSRWLMKNSKRLPSTGVEVFIGPEGDMSEREEQWISDKNYPRINLGPRRLRSETAVVTSVALIQEMGLNITQV